MADLVVVVGVLAFFALCVLYVAGLDQLIGPDGDTGPAARDADAHHEVGAGAEAAR